MRRTSRGRVVYDRKFHEFTPRDAVRVFGRVRWDLWDPAENVKLIIPLFIAICNVGWAQVGKLGGNVDEETKKSIGDILIPVLKFLKSVVDLIGRRLADWLNL